LIIVRQLEGVKKEAFMFLELILDALSDCDEFGGVLTKELLREEHKIGTFYINYIFIVKKQDKPSLEE